jgi:hypothetical protein
MKYLYAPQTSTLYYLEEDVLHGIPQSLNSTFDTDESFQVEHAALEEIAPGLYRYITDALSK